MDTHGRAEVHRACHRARPSPCLWDRAPAARGDELAAKYLLKAPMDQGQC